jgi:hypothetical protein
MPGVSATSEEEEDPGSIPGSAAALRLGRKRRIGFHTKGLQPTEIGNGKERNMND